MSPTAAEWRLILVCGVGWFGLYNLALNAAEQHLDAGTTAMLVNIDGPARYGPVSGSSLQRVVNTRVLLLRDMQQDTERHFARLVLLDGSVVELPTRKALPWQERARLRAVTAQLMHQVVPVRPGEAPAAIVRDIATVHGATLELAKAESGRGLKVSVTFPAPAMVNDNRPA